MAGKNLMAALLILAAAALLYFFVGPMLRPEAPEEAAGVATDVAVHVAEISRATLHQYVTAYGRIEPQPPGPGSPPASVRIGAPVSGLLVGIDCVEGRPVQRGEMLFRLDSRVAEVELQTARQTLEFAEKTFARQQELIGVEGTSQRAFQEATAARDAARNAVAAAETQLELLQITAPIDGTVVRIDAKLGQTVEANTTLAEIIDLDRLVVSAAVPSAEAAGLTIGMPVELDAGAETGGDAAGRVGDTGGSNAAGSAMGGGMTGGTTGEATGGRLLFIGSDVDSRTDTVMVRASVPAATSPRPGAFLALRILADEHADSLVVPEESLVTSADEGEWIVVVEGDQARRVAVVSGLREGGLVEVEGAGLTEGMTIVTEDAYSLPPQTTIHIVGR